MISSDDFIPESPEIDPSVSRIPPSAFPVEEKGNVIIHKEPRISASKLAEYVIADPARQRTIIREAKFAKKAILIPYTRARNAIEKSFNKNGLDVAMLIERAKEIADGNWKTEWHKQDNERCAKALNNVAGLADLTWNDATLIRGKWRYIEMAGVRVSVQPEIVFSFSHRNITKVGAVIISTAIKEDKALDRNKGNGPRVGDYLSSLLFQMLAKQLNEIGPPLNSKCFAVDVFRNTTYTAPASYKALNRQMEAACEFIAAIWHKVEQRG